jgi:adenylosuccinate lyase
MIERYVTPAMAAVWTDQSRFQTYLDIELANAEALCEKGIVPKSDLALLKTKATFSLERIREIEQQTKHDVIAFTRAVSESLGPEKRFIHYGLTSTDVVDTAYGVLFQKANRILKRDLERFLEVLRKNAMKYKHTMTIGRTHGMHAEVTTFGLKWALWHAEFERHVRRFEDARKDIEVGKLSGAVGNYAFIDPDIELAVLSKLGLGIVPISTQTLQRDRHAYYVSVLALIGASIEKIALEVRHLMRTEVGEVSEPFASDQKGSSAMPHKRNPIASENVSGLARVLRGYTIPAMESIALWHERDISHSSVERIVMPDTTSLLDYMLVRYATTLEGLVVNEDKMTENIRLTHGVVFTQRVLTALIDKGASREEAYDRVQAVASAALSRQIDFQTLCAEDAWIAARIPRSELDQCFTLAFYQTHVDAIYRRVFPKEE